MHATNELTKRISLTWELPRSVLKYYYEYRGQDVCNVFMTNEPLAGHRLKWITQTKTKADWPRFVEQIAR